MNIIDLKGEIDRLEKELSELDVDETTGNDLNIKIKMKDQLEKEFDNKILIYRHLIKRKEKNIELINEEIDRMTKAKQREIKACENIKEMILTVFEMKGLNKKEYATGEKISIRNYSTFEYNENILKEKGYLKEKIEITLDKEKAKKDFKNGILEGGVAEIKTKGLMFK